MSKLINQLPLDDVSHDGGAVVGSESHRTGHGFAHHFVEMFVVMVIGMFAAAFIYMTFINVAITHLTWERALIQYPIQSLLVIAFGMSVPMVAWMRYRGHSRRRSWEMAAAMALPVIPFVCLAAFHVVKGAQCSWYCVVSVVAMVGLMVYRRDEYSGRIHDTVVHGGSA